MPKSTRVILCLLTAVTLAACQGGAGSTQGPPAVVLGGAVKVAPPAGFCVDGKASRESQDTAVVLMGRCSTEVQAAAALISVSAGRSGSGGVMTQGPALLAEFFKTAPGRAALSRDGRANDVRVKQVSATADTVFLLVQDRAQGEYWRAVTSLGGRLISVSATGTRDIALDSAAGRKLVDAALLSIRRANPAKTANATG